MSFVRSSLAPKNSELLSLVFSAAAQDGCNAPDIDWLVSSLLWDVHNVR
jgi:hypothetical protein